MSRYPAMIAASPGLHERVKVDERVALVRAQLSPIRSRSALLDSYERESLNLLSHGATPGSEVQILELAYALRWLELPAESVARPGARLRMVEAHRD